MSYDPNAPGAPRAPGGSVPPPQPQGWAPPHQAPAQAPPAWPQPQQPSPYPPPQPGYGPPRQQPPPYPPPQQPPWPAPPGGTPEPDPRPSIVTLVAATIWRIGIGGAALHYAAEGKDETMSPDSLSYLSNVGVGIGSLALAAYPILVGGRRHEPRSGWLRGALTVMMLLVGLVFVLGMGQDPDGPHAVIPTLVLVDWLFVGRNQFRSRVWEPLTWIAFPLAYLFYHRANDLSLYPDILGEDNIATMVPILLVGCILVGYLLLGAALMRRAVTRSSSR